MVKIRTATVASVVLLLSTTLSATTADDSWSDMAQYTSNDDVTQQQQSTQAPVSSSDNDKTSDETSTEAPQSSGDNNGDSGDSNGSGNSWTQTPASSWQSSGNNDDNKDDKKSSESSGNSWTPAPASSWEASGSTWTQPPASSWESSGGDNNDDKKSSDSSGNSWTPPPASSSQSSGNSGDAQSESSENSDDNNEESSASSGNSWQHGPVSSSGGSQTSGGDSTQVPATSSSAGSQTTPSTSGGSVPDGTWPTSTGTVSFPEAHVIKAGEVFDGKMQTFDRSDVKCEGQTESGGSTAVFQLEAGATLKNAIIGVNQMEGVHCDDHDCTIENVWWEDVCEDALSIKGGSASSVSTVTGGGARSADDKVVQHNGLGTVKIDGFYGEDVSKLYRSCGTCGNKQRNVEVSNVYVVNLENAIVTVNKNYNDQATLSNIWVKSSKDKVKICQWSQGAEDGEPSMLGDGPSGTLCQYLESDVHINGDVSQAGGSSPSTSAAPATSSDGSNTSQTEPTDAPSTSSDGSSKIWTPQSNSADSSGDGGESDGDNNGDYNDDGGGNNGGGGDSTDAPTSSDGSETSWSQTPAISPTSSGSQTSSSQAPATSPTSSGNSDDTSTDAPAISSSGDSGNSWSQSPGTSSGGSQTSQATPSTSAGSLPDGTWPTSTGAVQFTEPHTIKAGEVFDGKMQTFDRSDITCTEGEGQKDSAVFLVEAGGTLKNAIIGKNQKEGVHCDDHDCTIENVWWDDVCEDALSIKGGSASSVTTVTNCGARYAKDKVVQHNGQGTVKIDGFYAEDFGKLYRSCGTCGDIPRIVTVSNVYAVDPQVSVITVNKNYGDQATMSNIWVKTSDGSNEVAVCQWSEGSKDPKTVGDGPSGTLCQYSESDVHINQDSSQAGGSSPSTSTAPTTSSDGSTSQTQPTQAPATSWESSGSGDGNDDGKKSSESSGNTRTQAPATPSGGSQTSWSQPPATSSESSGNSSAETTNAPSTSSTGSQTTGGSGGGDGGTTPSTSGGSVPDGTWPTSTGTVSFPEAHVIKAGEVFDGKMQTFDRSDVKCEGQTESGGSTAVFQLEAGATLKNAIIGVNQMEGVHCDDHDCTIENVWWEDVCEDALSIKGGSASSVSTVTGGGARSADDKVVQHNGLGTVKIDGFYGEDVSKLYRSCGTCGNKQRNVEVSNVYVVNLENAIVTVNKNYNDQATLSNIWVKSSKDKVKICQWSQGAEDGEPSMLGDGPSGTLCQYLESDVHINGDVSQAGGSSPSTSAAPATSSDSSSTSQAEPGTVAPASSGESNDDKSSGDNGNSWTPAPSTSSDGEENSDVENKESSSKGDGNSDDEKKDSSSDGDGNSDDDTVDSTQQNPTTVDSTQQNPSSDGDSVSQQEVLGEAESKNISDASTTTKMFETTNLTPSTQTTATPSKKCNIRRKRN